MMQQHLFFHLNKILHYIYKGLESGLINEKTALCLMQTADQHQKNPLIKQAAILRVAKLFIILGTSSILSSVLYFFASNWKSLVHLEKVALVLVTMGIPYCLYFLLKPNQERYRQLSLFAGVFIFGVAVALIGQIYNSHADSYMLFLVWSIPAIFLAVLLRFEPFNILSLILLNLSASIFIPTYFPQMMDFDIIYAPLSIMCLLNLCFTGLFYLLEHKKKTGRKAKYIAYILTLFFLYTLTFYGIVGWKLIITNGLLIGSILYMGYYHLRKKRDVPMVYINMVIGMIYLISKYIEITIYHFSEGLLILMILFGFGLLAINYFIIEKINLALKSPSNENN